MQHKTKDQLKAILKQQGYSLTAGRLLVFQTLWQQPPIEVKNIYNLLEDRMDRASIYRTLKLFEQLNIIHRISVGWKYKLELTDLFSHHHHHLTCEKCGCIIALIEDEVMEERIRKLASHYGVVLTSHQLEIQGICRQCQKLGVSQ